MSAEITLQQMMIIFLLIMIGFVCKRKNLVSDENNRCLSQLMVYVFNPAIILSSMTGAEIETGVSMKTAFFMAAFLMIFTIIVAALISRLLTKDHMGRRLYQLMFSFSNVGFIGIPLIRALFGAEYLIYVAAFILVYNLLIYTYGYSLLDSEKKRWKLRDLRPMLNMGTLACIITLLLFFSRQRMPQIINNTVNYLGDAAVPISLLFIGVNLGQQSLPAVFRNVQTYIFCLLKLIAIPAIEVCIIKRLPISENLCELYAVLAAMPVGTMPQIMVVERGIPAEQCTNMIILSTLLSILTIPLIVYLFPFL